MAKTKEQKKRDITKIADLFQQAKATVFVDYKGLSVNEVEKLRKELRKNQVDYLVAKKTLTNIALEKAGIKDVDAKKMEGQLALAFSQEDEVTPAKLLYIFSQEHEALKLLGGFLEGKFQDNAQVTALAQLPSKQELLAKAVGSLQAPLSGLVNVLQGNLRSLVYVLKAISEAKS